MSSPTYTTEPIPNPLMAAVVDHCLRSAYTVDHTNAYTTNSAPRNDTTIYRVDAITTPPKHWFNQ